MELKRKEADFLPCWAADGLGVKTILVRLPEHLERGNRVDNIKGSIIDLHLTADLEKPITKLVLG